MAGQVTIAAENNVYLTGNLLSGVNAGDAPTRENRNIIGLVAQNSGGRLSPSTGVRLDEHQEPHQRQFHAPPPCSTSSISGGSSGSYCLVGA